MRHLSLGSEMAPSITIAYVRMHVGVLSICFRKLVRPMIKTGRMYEKRVKIVCRVEHFRKATYN